MRDHQHVFQVIFAFQQGEVERRSFCPLDPVAERVQFLGEFLGLERFFLAQDQLPGSPLAERDTVGIVGVINDVRGMGGFSFECLVMDDMFLLVEGGFVGMGIAVVLESPLMLQSVLVKESGVPPLKLDFPSLFFVVGGRADQFVVLVVTVIIPILIAADGVLAVNAGLPSRSVYFVGRYVGRLSIGEVGVFHQMAFAVIFIDGSIRTGRCLRCRGKLASGFIVGVLRGGIPGSVSLIIRSGSDAALVIVLEKLVRIDLIAVAPDLLGIAALRVFFGQVFVEPFILIVLREGLLRRQLAFLIVLVPDRIRFAFERVFRDRYRFDRPLEISRGSLLFLLFGLLGGRVLLAAGTQQQA